MRDWIWGGGKITRAVEKELRGGGVVDAIDGPRRVVPNILCYREIGLVYCEYYSLHI